MPVKRRAGKERVLQITPAAVRRWREVRPGALDRVCIADEELAAALDLPPFGFSDRPGTYTREAQAARVESVMRALGAPPAIIVGHSFGSGAATEFVLRYPQSARGLVLIDPALGLMSPPSELPLLLRPKWIREILVSLTLTNPLATKPLLVLADEPTGNLDEATADEVLALTRDLVARTGCGFLMVTHSARLAATLDRHVNLSAGLIA